MQGMDAQQVNVDVGNRVHFIGNCEASKTPSNTFRAPSCAVVQ